jgi:uncharacterized 2Fe-2S/4Fe-4S cluster protein (DUF4445 family)
LSGEARREIEEVVRTVEKIETAVEPRFQEHFVDALAIPHRTAPSTYLSASVSLPERRTLGDPAVSAGIAADGSRTGRRINARRTTAAATEER